MPFYVLPTHLQLMHHPGTCTTEWCPTASILDHNKFFSKKFKRVGTGVKSTETSWMKLLNWCEKHRNMQTCTTDNSKYNYYSHTHAPLQLCIVAPNHITMTLIVVHGPLPPTATATGLTLVK